MERTTSEIVRAIGLAALLACCTLALPAQAGLDRLQGIWPALSACWEAPAGSRGMEITVRFSLKRNGEILGEPRITYSKLDAPAEAQRAFRSAVLATLRECTPLKISDELGGAIAGRPLSIRFFGHGNASARIGRYSETFRPGDPSAIEQDGLPLDEEP